MHTVGQHFEGRAPAVRAIYRQIISAARAAGPFKEEPKKTSIHLARKSAFAGIATRTFKQAAQYRPPEGPLLWCGLMVAVALAQAGSR